MLYSYHIIIILWISPLLIIPLSTLTSTMLGLNAWIVEQEKMNLILAPLLAAELFPNHSFYKPYENQLQDSYKGKN